MHPDITILQRYDRTRDPEAFAQLVGRHAAMVHAAALRVTQSAADADDVTQDCFLELCRKAAQIRTSVAAWLHLRATHRALDLRRASLARLRAQENAGAPTTEVDASTLKEMVPLLDQVLAELPDEQRVPLVCHYLEGRPQSAVARELGVSQPAVSLRIREGLLALRRKMKARGVDSVPTEMGSLMAGFCVLPLPAAVKTSLIKIGLMGLGGNGMTAAGAAAKSAAGAKAFVALLPALTIGATLSVAGILGWHYLQPSPRPAAAAAPAVAAPATPARTYATTFPLAENPLSDTGAWINGATIGRDWTDVRTAPGFAGGTDSGNPALHDDSTALLTGAWGPDQSVQATVRMPRHNDGVWQEVELRLRSSLSAHRCTGYEINFLCAANSATNVEIVRWNEGRDNFTFVSRGAYGRGLADGDVIKATIVGKVITASINGVQVLQGTDGTYASGNPGMGFYHHGPVLVRGDLGGDYGFSGFTAMDGVATAASAATK